MTTFYTLNNRVYYVPVGAIPCLNDNLEASAFHNRLHPLLNLGEEPLKKIVAYAGPYRGFLHQTCRAFFKRVEPIDNCLAMAGEGDLAMLKKIRPKADRWNDICIAALAGSGREKARLDVLKWLVNEHDYDINSMPLDYAAQYGHTKILEWARRETSGIATKSPLPHIMTEVAIGYGQIKVLEWARLKGADVKNIVVNYEIAASNGHLNVLQWALKNRVKLGSYPFFSAASKGHLHILKWGYESKLFTLDDSLFRSASRAGHFDVLKWLKANGAPMDWGDFNPDDMGCHKIEAIIWASDNGLDEGTVKEYLSKAEPHKKIA